MNYHNVLSEAICQATIFHKGQTDLAGEPYILHCLRVMHKVKGPKRKIVAVLHDVIEDTAAEIEDLYSFNLTQELIDAIIVLTKMPNEDYRHYIERVSTHPIATDVKIADLLDNLRKDRISDPTEKDEQRWNKYEDALYTLMKNRSVA